MISVTEISLLWNMLVGVILAVSNYSQTADPSLFLLSKFLICDCPWNIQIHDCPCSDAWLGTWRRYSI